MSGKAALLVGGPPGRVLQTVVDGLPSGDTGAMVPIELTPIGERMVPNGLAGVVVVVLPMTVGEVTGKAGAPDTICGTGVAQVTNVPGVAGLEANGTGASVVPGAPG